MATNPSIMQKLDLCYWIAAGHGIEEEQADECENGKLGCPDCPFTQDAVKRRRALALQRHHDEHIIWLARRAG